MGPGDPFATQGGWTPPSAEDEFDGGADAPEAPAGAATGAIAGPDRRRRAMAIGLIIGLLFGAVIVFRGVLAALIIGTCGGIGLAAGWVVFSVLYDEFDVHGAIRALRRRP